MAKRGRKPITWETVRDISLAWPGVEESTSYGTPALKVAGKLFVRLREENDVIVVRIDPAARTLRMAADPTAFFITDHYLDYPYMLVRLSAVSEVDLKELLRDAWEIIGGTQTVAGSPPGRRKKTKQP